MVHIQEMLIKVDEDRVNSGRSGDNSMRLQLDASLQSNEHMSQVNTGLRLTLDQERQSYVLFNSEFNTRLAEMHNTGLLYEQDRDNVSSKLRLERDKYAKCTLSLSNARTELLTAETGARQLASRLQTSESQCRTGAFLTTAAQPGFPYNPNDTCESKCKRFKEELEAAQRDRLIEDNAYKATKILLDQAIDRVHSEEALANKKGIDLVQTTRKLENSKKIHSFVLQTIRILEIIKNP